MAEFMSSACKDVVELVPFFLNGSLGAEEEKVRSHLAACSRCRQELAEAQQAWLVFDSHIPSLLLAEYAQGTGMEFEDRKWIEDHLGSCLWCSELVGLVETDRCSDDLSSGLAEQKGAGERRWPVAASRIAAGLVAVAAFLWLVGSPKGVEQSQPTIESVSAGSTVGSESALSTGTPFLDGFESGTTLAWSLAEHEREEPSDLDI